MQVSKLMRLDPGKLFTDTCIPPIYFSMTDSQTDAVEELYLQMNGGSSDKYMLTLAGCSSSEKHFKALGYDNLELGIWKVYQFSDRFKEITSVPLQFFARVIKSLQWRLLDTAVGKKLFAHLHTAQKCISLFDMVGGVEPKGPGEDCYSAIVLSSVILSYIYIIQNININPALRAGIMFDPNKGGRTSLGEVLYEAIGPDALKVDINIRKLDPTSLNLQTKGQRQRTIDTIKKLVGMVESSGSVYELVVDIVKCISENLKLASKSMNGVLIDDKFAEAGEIYNQFMFFANQFTTCNSKQSQKFIDVICSQNLELDNVVSSFVNNSPLKYVISSNIDNESGLVPFIFALIDMVRPPNNDNKAITVHSIVR